MISQTTIEQVRQLDLYQVISSEIELKKKGVNYIGHSPFNDEKTPSFNVNPSKQIWKCFSSGKGGKTPWSFIMEKEGLSWIEAVEYLAKQHNITIERENWSEEKQKQWQKQQEERKDMASLLEMATAYFESNQLPDSFTKYRKFSEKHLAPFGVGYAEEKWESFYTEAKKAGFEDSLLLKSGLVNESKGKKFDAFRNRIIFPIHDVYGNVVAFTGRVADDNDQPKYYNSPDSLWNKSQHLYGLYQCKTLIQKMGKAYLVEGNTDVIRCQKHGIPAVAACGTSLTSDQIKLLKRFTDTVVIMPDNDMSKTDNPGIAAMHRSAKLLLQQNIHVKCLIPGK